MPGALVGVDTEVREKMDVREVVVPCERREERSEVVVAVDWTEVRAEGGCERGWGAFEGGIAIAAVAATGGGGGGRWRVFWREREELLAEGGADYRLCWGQDGMGSGKEVRPIDEQRSPHTCEGTAL